MKTLDDLRAARALIARPEHWCQGSFGRNADGLAVPANSVDAVRWCLMGALAKDGLPPRSAVTLALVAALPPGQNPASLSTYNDQVTHEEVLALFDRAIAAEEARS